MIVSTSSWASRGNWLYGGRREREGGGGERKGGGGTIACVASKYSMLRVPGLDHFLFPYFCSNPTRSCGMWAASGQLYVKDWHAEHLSLWMGKSGCVNDEPHNGFIRSYPILGTQKFKMRPQGLAWSCQFWFLRIICRFAVLVFVATPLAIWLWSLVAQKGTQDAVKRIMFGYWQVCKWVFPATDNFNLCLSWVIVLDVCELGAKKLVNILTISSTSFKDVQSLNNTGSWR